MRAGAVADLQHVKTAIGTARLVMERTSHTLLSGQQADAFAAQMGQQLANLSTPSSTQRYQSWYCPLEHHPEHLPHISTANQAENQRNNWGRKMHAELCDRIDDMMATAGCTDHASQITEEMWCQIQRQPAAPTTSQIRLPYMLMMVSSLPQRLTSTITTPSPWWWWTQQGVLLRDHLPMEQAIRCCLSSLPGQRTSPWACQSVQSAAPVLKTSVMASGCGSLRAQVPGRVGDAAVPGGGSYASPDGGCASTGDGDVHLRFQPCLLVC